MYWFVISGDFHFRMDSNDDQGALRLLRISTFLRLKQHLFRNYALKSTGFDHFKRLWKNYVVTQRVILESRGDYCTLKYELNISDSSLAEE